MMVPMEGLGRSKSNLGDVGDAPGGDVSCEMPVYVADLGACRELDVLLLLVSSGILSEATEGVEAWVGGFAAACDLEAEAAAAVAAQGPALMGLGPAGVFEDTVAPMVDSPCR